MSSLVGTLVRGTISTAYGAARHPVSTATQAVGLAHSAVRLGLGVVHGRIPGGEPASTPRPPAQRPEQPQPAAPGGSEPSASTAAAPSRLEDGTPIPTPAEVAVRATGPLPGAPGEAFATEPKVAGRDVAHGGSATGDREAVEGFLEDMEAGEPESPIDAIGSTTGTPEPGEEAAVLSEAETLQRGAERNPGE